MICKKIDIWSGLPYDERPNPGFRPRLDVSLLDGEKTRGAVVVIPGGGYFFTSEREGEPIATQFSAAGFQTFVLWYSVAPHRHPQPLADLARAICLIRENAAQWHVDPDRIAVIGFSAGGHLAASLGVHWDKPWLAEIPGITASGARPNALMLSYPVITSGPHAHRGSFENLLGEHTPVDLLQLVSLETQVGAHTPPTFLWHTVADDLVPVENSLLFAQALQEAGVPFELHLYPDGNHGLALANEETAWLGAGIDPHVATWMKLCTEWLSTCLGDDNAKEMALHI